MKAAISSQHSEQALQPLQAWWAGLAKWIVGVGVSLPELAEDVFPPPLAKPQKGGAPEK
jgi:hypothetical protein